MRDGERRALLIQRSSLPAGNCRALSHTTRSFKCHLNSQLTTKKTVSNSLSEENRIMKRLYCKILKSSLTWSMVRRSASEMLSALGTRFSEEGACRSPVPESTSPISPPTGPWTIGVVKRSAELVKHCYPSLRSTDGTPPANDGLVLRERLREKGREWQIKRASSGEMYSNERKCRF